MMSLQKRLLCLHITHVVAVVGGYLFVALDYCSYDFASLFGATDLSGTTKREIRNLVVDHAKLMFALVGMFTGFCLLIRRKGESESIALAMSTIAAFLLLFLAPVRMR